MENASDLCVSVLCPADDQKKIRSGFHNKTQNKKEQKLGREAEAVDVLRLLKWVDYNIWADLLWVFWQLRQERDIHWIRQFFFFLDKRRHINSSVETIYFCWHETRVDHYWTYLSLQNIEQYLGCYPPSQFPKHIYLQCPSPPTPQCLAWCVAHSGRSLRAAGWLVSGSSCLHSTPGVESLALVECMGSFGKLNELI